MRTIIGALDLTKLLFLKAILEIMEPTSWKNYTSPVRALRYGDIGGFSFLLIEGHSLQKCRDTSDWYSGNRANFGF